MRLRKHFQRLCALALGLSSTTFALAMEAPVLNRPPVAAPVERIAVGALPVLRSQSEATDDVISGLIPGLMAGARGVDGVSFVAVREDHVVVRRDFGEARSDAPFPAGALADIPIAIAAMQQVEKGSILLSRNLAGGTVEAALAYQGGATPSNVIDEVARAAGEPFFEYLAQRVFAPLRMRESAVTSAGFRTSIADMGQLMIALLNGGAVGDGRVLETATVEAMERTHVLSHPALGGYALGFPEMRFNGWRALAHDAMSDGVQARLVLVPEARLGYFVLVRGRADARFWRALDDTLLGQLFAAREETNPDPAGIAAPSFDAARGVAGLYGARAGAVFLKTEGQRLHVAAREDAALELSGAENAVLLARAGGYWSSENGAMRAATRDGALILTGGVFEPLAPRLRWETYLFVSLIAAFFGLGVFTFEHRGSRTVYVPGDLVLAGGATSGVFGILAILVYVLAPM